MFFHKGLWWRPYHPAHSGRCETLKFFYRAHLLLRSSILQMRRQRLSKLPRRTRHGNSDSLTPGMAFPPLHIIGVLLDSCKWSGSIGGTPPCHLPLKQWSNCHQFFCIKKLVNRESKMLLCYQNR